MGLGAITEDVVFDHAGAASLARELRLTADLLDTQRTGREEPARTARAEWRGTYGDQFDQRLRVCSADALELAAALRLAANGLEELAAAATQEQDRRVAARAWQKEQDERAWYETAADNVHDFFAGEDDIPPPPPPEDPPRYVSSTCVAASR